MTRKKLKLYTPKEDVSEFDNFKDLAKKLVKVESMELDEGQEKMPKNPKDKPGAKMRKLV